MSTDAFREQLAQLNAEYRAALPARLVEIDALWSKASAGGGAPMTELHRLLHSVAGSAKTFGLPAVSAAAREAEHCIEALCGGKAQPAAPSAAGRERAAGLLAALRSASGN